MTSSRFSLRPSKLAGITNEVDAFEFDAAAAYKLEELDRIKRESLATDIANKVLIGLFGSGDSEPS